MNLVAYVVSQVKYDTVLEGAVGFFCGAVSQYTEFKSFFWVARVAAFQPIRDPGCEHQLGGEKRISSE